MSKKEIVRHGFLGTATLTAVGTLLLVVLFGNPYAVKADVAPTIDSVALTDPSNNNLLTLGLSPIEAGTLSVTVSGQVSDGDGCGNIYGVDIYLARSGVWPVRGFFCATDNNDCYGTWLSSAQLTNCTGNTANYSAVFDVANYVDPTDIGSYASENWIVAVRVTDSAGRTATHESSTFEVNSLAAFTTSPSLDFGSLPLDGYSATQFLTFANSGNTNVNANIKADGPMVSDLAGFDVIPAENIQFSTTDNFDLGGGMALSTTDSLLSIQLPQQTIGVPTREAYFRLHMPASGVKGHYTNTIIFTAVMY